MVRRVLETRKVRRTKQKLILVYNIADTEVECTKDEDRGLYDTIQYRDSEDEDSLRIHNTIIDHGWRVQLRKI